MSMDERPKEYTGEIISICEYIDRKISKISALRVRSSLIDRNINVFNRNTFSSPIFIEKRMLHCHFCCIFHACSTDCSKAGHSMGRSALCNYAKGQWNIPYLIFPASNYRMQLEEYHLWPWHRDNDPCQCKLQGQLLPRGDIPMNDWNGLTAWPSQGAIHLRAGWQSLAAWLICDTPNQEFPCMVTLPLHQGCWMIHSIVSLISSESCARVMIDELSAGCLQLAKNDRKKPLTNLWTPSHHVTFTVEGTTRIDIDYRITSVRPFCWVGTFEFVVSRKCMGIDSAIVRSCLVAVLIR